MKDVSPAKERGFQGSESVQKPSKMGAQERIFLSLKPGLISPLNVLFISCLLASALGSDTVVDQCHKIPFGHFEKKSGGAFWSQAPDKMTYAEKGCAGGGSAS